MIINIYSLEIINVVKRVRWINLENIKDHEYRNMFIFIWMLKGCYYFLLKILETEHDRTEPNYPCRVPPPGPAHHVRAPVHVLCPVLSYVSHHCPGEPSHYFPYSSRLPSPHTDIFVSQQVVILWPLFSSVTIPKLLQNMRSKIPSISYAGCLTQIYFFLFFGDLESFLLVVMAYDHYVAICFPLHYTSIMNTKLCGCLVTLSWVLTTFYPFCTPYSCPDCLSVRTM
jgi:hypothetical protein